MRSVDAQNTWNFELGVENGSSMLSYIRFLQTDRLNSQELSNDTFFRPPVNNAQCIIGTEKNPETGLNCDYENEMHCQAQGENVSCFGQLTKDNIFHPYWTQPDFRRENDRNQMGYKLYVFDVRYNQD